MRYLSSQDLMGLIPPRTLIAAIEQALRDFAAGKVIVPVRAHVDFDGNTLLLMPVIGADSFGVKSVSVVPGNATRGLPVTNGLMTLSDATGVPRAVLNAAALTAQRTGAVGAVGLEYTTPKDADSIGVIGTGVQGTWQAIFACAVRPIRTIYFIARTDEQAQRFIAAVSPQVSGVQFSRCAAVTELLRKTQIVIAATTSSEPVIPADPAGLENRHFVSVGSFKPSMQELPGAVYRLAPSTVIDSEAAKIEVGDIIEPMARGLLREENIVHLADLVVGRKTIDTERTTVFKSVGMALYDLYAARAFLAEAQQHGRGTPLEL